MTTIRSVRSDEDLGPQQEKGHFCRRQAEWFFAPPIRNLPERHRLARKPQIFASTGTLHLGAGSSARLVIHFCRRFSTGSGRVDHSALSNVYSLCRVHHSRPDCDDTAVQWHAVIAVNGLRPRDGQHAYVIGKPVSALVSSLLEAGGRDCRFAIAGLYVSADRTVLGRRAARYRISSGAAGAGAFGPYAGSAWHADFFGRQAARELCGRHEFRDLSHVLCLVGALSAVAGAREQSAALLCLPVQSFHARG